MTGDAAPCPPCPRCDAEAAVTVAVAPADGSWEVRQCERCWYTWRTTEPPERTTPGRFPAAFRMTAAAIDAAPEVPTVPASRN
jgi:hypothetical protein